MGHPVIEKLNRECGSSLESLGRELSQIRTGRANPALLDSIRVDYYGTQTPLKQMANVTVPDSRTLMIAPWDATQISAIEKAILASDLGLTPTNDGKVVRINIPLLTEERRKDLAKVVRKFGEQAKVSMRNHRKDANDEFKKLEKDKKISQDEMHRFSEEVQKVTDQFILKVDKALATKEKEILEV